MPVTQSLRQLLDQKSQYDKRYGSKEEMPPRVLQCYQNLQRELRKAADRNQMALPTLEQEPEPSQEGQMMLI